MSDEYDRIVSMGWGSATSGDMSALQAERDAELKPCPFCGGEATIYEDSAHSTAVWFGCGNDDCPCNKLWHETHVGAFTAWNTRTDPTLAALRAERDAWKARAEAAEAAVIRAYERGRGDAEKLCTDAADDAADSSGCGRESASWLMAAARTIRALTPPADLGGNNND